MFLDWKTWIKLQPMEHYRISIKRIPFFVAILSELQLELNLVRWSTYMIELLTLMLHKEKVLNGSRTLMPQSY